MILFEIKRRREKDYIQIDLEFQRDNIWYKKQKYGLIESVLMGIPISAFYFFETKEGKIQIINGRHKINNLLIL